MTQFHLHKQHPRKENGSSPREWISARWTIKEAPGFRLCILCASGLDGKKITGWKYSLPLYLLQEENRDPLLDYSLTLYAWPSLEGQFFSTRHEALQALSLLEELKEEDDARS